MSGGPVAGTPAQPAAGTPTQPAPDTPAPSQTTQTTATPALIARVTGASTIFPRGFIWQFPVWYGAIVLYLALISWPPLWFRISAAVGLLGALITLFAVLGSLSLRAFYADEVGITLGLPATTRRRGRRRRALRHLPWDQVERIRLRPRTGGARLEIFLGENAPASARAVRYSSAERAWRWVLLLIPFWYLRRPTGLLSPLDGPPRYRVLIRGTTFEELRQRLRALAPAEIPIVIVVRRNQVRSVSSAPSPERAT